MAEPEAPKRARATRSSKGKGLAIASATDGEDSDASLSDASTFVDNHSPVEDTFQPLEDEEINQGGVVNEGEGGAVNEDGVVNKGEGPSGDQPLHVGPSGDHPSQAGPSGDHLSQTGQNEDQPSQTCQNREQPSRTMNFHHTDLEDTRLEEGDQADEAKAAARVRRKNAYVRIKAATAAKKVALNASQPNVAETAGIGLRASKRQRT
ncbi:hypothetical protein GBA52_007889 [Prunus armeniaca]|nr:hypothetical protein GBA52_007889 [Prunus armeniaca]